MKPVIALIYIRNYQEVIFPVKDIQHAITLANSIADSDLLNERIEFNMFDVCQYENGVIGDSWESDDGKEFNDVWKDSKQIE